MSYDLLRFSLLFRRFVNVKADSELLCALFRESSCTSIHLFRAPPQSNQTQKPIQLQLERTNPTQKQKSVPFCAGFSSASPDATLYSRRPNFNTKPHSCGFYLHSDRLLGRLLLRLIDSHHFSENAHVQIVRVSRRPLPSTLLWTLLRPNTPVSSRRKTPLAVRRTSPRPRRDSLCSTDAQTRARARVCASVEQRESRRGRGEVRRTASGVLRREETGVFGRKSVQSRVLGNGRRETRTIWTWAFSEKWWESMSRSSSRPSSRSL